MASKFKRAVGGGHVPNNGRPVHAWTMTRMLVMDRWEMED